VLLFDYRGYGTSSEFNISDRFYIYSQFSIDVTAALNYVRKYHAVFQVSMAGTGMGAGLAVAIGANRSEVKYIVGDGAYPTLDIVQSQYQKVEGKKILMPLGYDKVYMEPHFALESEGDHLRGVLLIQSKGDKIITSQHAEELAGLQKKKTNVFLIDSEDNSQNLEANKDGYFSALKDFMGN
jgi:pimeloyl-ACP methyl ester carboxylesterase